VKEPDTLARRLEKLLNADRPGSVEVRNCGRRGLDFPELRQAFEDALAYEPDLLVYALVPNDAERPPEFQARQGYVNDWILDRENEPDLDEEPRTLSPRLFGFVGDRFSRWRVARETTRWYTEMWTDANPGWARTQLHLREMDRALAARGARLLVATWPLLVGLEQATRSRRSTPRWPARARRPIPLHDLLGALRSRRTDGLWVHLDHHPNDVANALAAASLAPVVRGCWNGPEGPPRPGRVTAARMRRSRTWRATPARRPAGGRPSSPVPAPAGGGA
jgi:hypothetical protein